MSLKIHKESEISILFRSVIAITASFSTYIQNNGEKISTLQKMFEDIYLNLPKDHPNFGND